MLGSCLSKYSRVSLRVLGISPCPWDGSQVGPVIGCPFPQSLIHLYSCMYCRQEKRWVEGFGDGLGAGFLSIAAEYLPMPKTYAVSCVGVISSSGTLLSEYAEQLLSC